MALFPKDLLSPLRLPEVATTLPAFNAGEKGAMVRLDTDGLVYLNDGTQWRKLGHLGQTTVQGIRESASGSIVLPGSLLSDFGANEVEIGAKLDHTAQRLPLGYSDRVLGGVAVQPGLGEVAFASVLPGAGNVLATLGFPATKTGTFTSGTAPAVTNVKTRALRQIMPTAATAGSSVGLHYALAPLLMPDGAGRGGFHYRAVFGFNAYTAASRFFVGVRVGTALITNVEPSTLVNFVGFGANTTHTNIHRYAASGSATTPVDTGQAIGTTNLWKVTICAYNPAEIFVSLVRLSDGLEYTATLTTGIPGATTYLGPVMWINNGANAAVSSMDLVKSHVEWKLTG